MQIEELLGKDLEDFKIVEMTEVYRVNDDGHKSRSVGFFKNPNIAVAFAGVQTDAIFHKTEQVLVLTDGTIGYVIARQESVKFFDEEEEALKIKNAALAKLSPPERKLLGFE